MLLELKIQNFTLIERAEIGAGEGFNVLTGETGAGKSILIKAMGLLIGERATGDQVGPRAARAVVEATFDIQNVPRARRFLEDNGIECNDETLLISREVEASGRSRVRIAGRLGNNTTLKELGEILVDFHGQHENQKLLHPEAHLSFLDAFGDRKHAETREKTREKYRIWRDLERRLSEISRGEQERVQRLDMLQFQAEEIDKAKLQAGEESELNAERTLLLNAEKLRESADGCVTSLWGGEELGAIGAGKIALKFAKTLEATDESVREWREQLENALFEIEDAAERARDYAHRLEADPARLEKIEARLAKVNRLRRKYGQSVEEILVYRAQIEEETAALSYSEDQVAALKNDAECARGAFFESAEKLRAARQKLAKTFALQVEQQLSGLAMEKARFEVGFQLIENGSAQGIDRCEFLFSANPGQPLRPLAKIASGGEISRVMLALRSVLRGTTPETAVPVVIFDEVDTGIGGLTAEKVGEKMQQIAASHQVFCITHLPQIAKRADHHFRVVKAAGPNQTTVDVTPLDASQRVLELARMMGAETQSNIEHARELLESSRRDETP